MHPIINRQVLIWRDSTSTLVRLLLKRLDLFCRSLGVFYVVPHTIQLAHRPVTALSEITAGYSAHDLSTRTPTSRPRYTPRKQTTNESASPPPPSLLEHAPSLTDTMSEIQPGFDIFPPTPTFFRQRRHSPPSHRRRKKIRWGAVLYQISFSFFILLIVVLLAGSGWGLSEQALRGGRTRFNIFIILAAYVFMVGPLLFPPPLATLVRIR